MNTNSMMLKKYNLKTTTTPDPEKCQCGEVLQGLLNQMNVSFLGKNVLHTTRSVLLWFLQKDHVQHTIITNIQVKKF